MAGTVVGAAIDYVVAQLAAPALVVADDAMVIDGLTNDEWSTSMIWVGRTAPDDLQAAVGTRSIPVLGRRPVDEVWRIDGFCDARREGTAQKVSRDAALALFDVVAHLVGTDPSLGGLLTSGWYVLAPNAQLVQPDPPQTAWSRSVVLWTIEIRNRYSP